MTCVADVLSRLFSQTKTMFPLFLEVKLFPAFEEHVKESFAIIAASGIDTFVNQENE